MGCLNEQIVGAGNGFFNFSIMNETDATYPSQVDALFQSKTIQEAHCLWSYSKRAAAGHELPDWPFSLENIYRGARPPAQLGSHRHLEAAGTR